VVEIEFQGKFIWVC